ncbi:unnamed protein product [Ixodes pacificus]
MNILGLVTQLSGLRVAHQCSRLAPPIFPGLSHIHTSARLNAEPLKKKKRLDPAILRMREERRKRRIEKGIRHLKKHAKKHKPIEEMEVAPKLQKEIGLRHRTLPVLDHETCQLREAMQRAWTVYCKRMHENEASMVERVVAAQQKALDMLQEESPELYQAAVQVDEGLLPFKLKAVVSTPPLKNYEVPDGKYVDTTKKWRP